MAKIYTTIQVRRDTTANWLLNKDVVPAAGEPCLDTDTGIVKYGNGTDTYENLPASSESYNADNIYFAEDLVLTYQFGKYSPQNGKVTVPANGKSVSELFEDAFAEDIMPSVTQPSVTLNSAQIMAYEVGTEVTPQYTATFNPGSYEFDETTGVTVTSWSVTDTNSGSQTTASGSFDAFTVADDTNYSITATANYGDGAIPTTALGNDYAAGQIKAGSKSATKSKISGYRNSFYGTLTTKDGTVNSALIRGLTGKSNKALVNGNSFNISIPVGAIRVVFAYPATLRDVSSVQDVNGMNAEIKSAFTKSTVTVEGASGYTGIDYKVYVMDMANANDTANTYKVTI